MKLNLFILGEEQASLEIMTVISWWIKSPLSVDVNKVRFIPVPIYGNLFFKIEGVALEQYHSVYYGIISKTGNSFVDYLIYEGNTIPEEDSLPVAALEATKNDGKESGNMSDQRAGKSIALRSKWENIPFGYLINHPNPISKTVKTFGLGHNCAFATMKALRTDVIIAQTDKVEFKKYDNPITYDSIESVIVAENSKQKRAGTPCRVNRVGNKIQIQAKLIKNGGKHDPSEGYVASRACLIRQLDPNITIEIVNHQQDLRYFQRKNNKFINCLKKVGVTVIFDDSSYVIEREDNVYEKSYWRYSKTGEKMCSIVLEHILISKGHQIIFTNHAGCGKSWKKINGEYFQTKKSKGIPDLVSYNPTNATLYVIEAETTKNYKKGLAQVRDQNFDTFIEREFLPHFPKDTKVLKYLCTYGQYNQEPEVLFNLTGDFQMNYNENAEVIQ